MPTQDHIPEPFPPLPTSPCPAVRSLSPSFGQQPRPRPAAAAVPTSGPAGPGSGARNAGEEGDNAGGIGRIPLLPLDPQQYEVQDMCLAREVRGVVPGTQGPSPPPGSRSWKEPRRPAAPHPAAGTLLLKDLAGGLRLCQGAWGAKAQAAVAGEQLFQAGGRAGWGCVLKGPGAAGGPELGAGVSVYPTSPVPQGQSNTGRPPTPCVVGCATGI